ncbi:MAG: response regulator [Lachnospiraceae bacterium]|nr:response regulator [Lachnospiraceae bacterium]
MPNNITVYDLLISCPSDVAEYVDMLEQEVLHFNNFFGRFNNVIIRTRHWSKDSYSESGNPPQELLNKQIVDSSDLALAVFWTRFGTPTENYGSGSEEEIERMLAMGKQVFLYFLDKPVCPSQINQDQYKKIQTFMNKHKNKGIFFSVPDEKTLANKFRENLELYFDSITRGAEFKKNSGKKKLLWVDDRPENNVYERNTLEQYGLVFTLALSTQQALEYMKHNEFALIISDMGRKEGKHEGYVLLDAIRKNNKKIPFIIYAGSKNQAHINETLKRGGQGCTNSPRELIDLVIKNLLNN